MKNLSLIFAAALVIAGCSQKAPPVEEAATEAPETAEEIVVETTEEAPTDVSEEAVEVVEESAGGEDTAGDEAIVLAQADTAAPTQSWKYREGRHFTRFVPTQPTVGGPDKIEVVEIFMYSCPGCFGLEPYINDWAANKDANVRFERIPAPFNGLAEVHVQLYYTLMALARSGELENPEALHDRIFNEFHRRNNRLGSEAAIQRLFASAGVEEDAFERAWNSFEVDQKMRIGADLVRRYGTNSVPAFVINGKYRTNVEMAGGPTELLELIDELTVREGLR